MQLTCLFSIGLLTAALAPAAAAQTTHDVQLLTQTFSPANITIEVGDTVRWTWVNGFHNVVSGDGGTPDGIWDSGLFPSPNVFELTFDAAFVAANPVPNNVYDYYCIVHLPGMTGTVTVQQPSNGQVNPYGSGVNAAGSFLTNGTPTLGQSLGIRLRNPNDATAGPGFGVLLLATQPDAAFPGGTVVPGFGLSPAPSGEILISIAPPNPALSLGPLTWTEGGNVDFFLTIPNDVNLVGRKLYAQGALVDTASPTPIGLTGAAELVIG